MKRGGNHQERLVSDQGSSPDPRLCAAPGNQRTVQPPSARGGFDAGAAVSSHLPGGGAARAATHGACRTHAHPEEGHARVCRQDGVLHARQRGGQPAALETGPRQKGPVPAGRGASGRLQAFVPPTGPRTRIVAGSGGGRGWYPTGYPTPLPGSHSTPGPGGQRRPNAQESRRPPASRPRGPGTRTTAVKRQRRWRAPSAQPCSTARPDSRLGQWPAPAEGAGGTQPDTRRRSPAATARPAQAGRGDQTLRVSATTGQSA
jgi:hypothetical protein